MHVHEVVQCSKNKAGVEANEQQTLLQFVTDAMQMHAKLIRLSAVNIHDAIHPILKSPGINRTANADQDL